MIKQLIALFALLSLATLAFPQQKPKPAQLPGLCECGCMPGAMHCDGSGGGSRGCTPTAVKPRTGSLPK